MQHLFNPPYVGGPGGFCYLAAQQKMRERFSLLLAQWAVFTIIHSCSSATENGISVGQQLCLRGGLEDRICVCCTKSPNWVNTTKRAGLKVHIVQGGFVCCFLPQVVLPIRKDCCLDYLLPFVLCRRVVQIGVGCLEVVLI